MKKAISFSFLVLFLAANTELHQLLRLPVLLHHYFEHYEQNQDETFGAFLDEHYSSKSNHQTEANHQDHDNLPFKTHDCATAHVSIALVNQHQLAISKPTIYHHKVTPTRCGINYSSSFHNSIWQPPKHS